MGFPSAADDYLEGQLDFNGYLIKHPASTFVMKAKSNALKEHGIWAGDILIIDRSLVPKEGRMVVAVVDGEFAIKPFNPRVMTPESSIEIWGVITHAVHAF